MIIDELFEGPQQCPECGGISFSDLILAEKKDACYHKVKASAKVWPSAYASGRLVQCRKKGAANYGNKSEGVAEGSDQQWVVTVGTKTGGTSHTMTFSGTKEQAIKQAVARFGTSKNPVVTAKPKQQGVAEGSEPQVGDAVYYGKRLVGWFKGYGEHGKIITEPNYEEMGDEYANRDVYWDPQDKITIKPEQGVAEEEPIKVTADVAANWPMAETRRGQIPMTLNPGESDNLEPENIAGFRQLPAYKQGQAAQQKAGKQLIQKSPYTFQSDQDWAYRQGAFDAQQAAMFANFGKSKPLTIEGGEQQKGADYRDPKEVDYDDEYNAMVARVKKLAGLGPMKTVYDPNKRVYRNMPTAQQPKK